MLSSGTLRKYYSPVLKPIFHCDAKPLALGPLVWLDPKCDDFALPIPTCWYLKMLKFALPLTPTLKFALPPTRNPNTSQWNIGCVGSPMQNFCVGHVHFMLFIPFCSHWVPNANTVLSGIWALHTLQTHASVIL